MARPAFAYRVVVGDTLTTIAANQIGSPVYGKSGSLAQLLSLNPKIRDLDRIYPGQEIVTLTNEPIEASATPASEVKNSARAIASDEVIAPSAETPVTAAVAIPARPSAIGLGFDFGYLRIDGRDDANGGTTATFLSEVSPALSIMWKQSFSDDWQGRIRFGWMQLNMQNFATRRFEADHISLAEGSYELRRSFRSFDGYGRVGLSQQVFIRSIDIQALALESALSPEVVVGGELSLFHLRTFQGSLRGEYGFLGSGKSANFDVSTGYSFSAAFSVSQKLRAGELQSNIGYRSNQQSSPQLGTIDRSSLELGVSYEWMFE